MYHVACCYLLCVACVALKAFANLIKMRAFKAHQLINDLLNDLFMYRMCV